MADVQVYNAVQAGPHSLAFRAIVYVSETVGYAFYIDSGTVDLVFKKTTDGGVSWGTATAVFSGNPNALDVWYDGWTPGDAGGLIHVVTVDTITDDVFYANVDTSDDSVSSPVVVFAGASSAITNNMATVAKTRGGNLVVLYDIDGGTESGAAKSTNGGTSFSGIATPMEAVQDYFLVFPGNDADNQDAWALFWDRSANAVSLKVYDDSGNSWSEAAIIAATDAATTVGVGMNGSVRHSDGHLIAVIATERASATGDLVVYDIASAASITALTNVLTNKAQWYTPAIWINQGNDDLYVAYSGSEADDETLGTSLGAYYKVSVDAGATWGAETAYSDSAYDLEGVYVDLGGAANRFQPMIFDEGNGDIYVNFTNSVEGGGGGGGAGGSLLLLGVGT